MTALMATLIGFSQFCYEKSKQMEEAKKYKIAYYILFVLAILPMALVAGLRYEVGTDYNHTYVPNFLNALTETGQYSEYPFLWLNMLLRRMTDNPVWLFLIMGFMFSIFMHLSIRKFSSNWALSSLLLVLGMIFFVSLNNSRQMVGLSLAVYGFTFAFDKKIIPSILCIAGAMCFHMSLIMLLPFYFLIHLKFLRKYILIVLAVLLCISPFMNPIVRFILPYFKYGYYFESEHDNGQTIYTYFIQTCSISLISLLYYKALNKEYGKKFFAVFLMSSIATIIGFMGFFVKIPEMMSRFLLNFSWANLFLIPMIYHVEKNKVCKVCILMIMLLLTLAPTYIMIGIWRNHEVLPYHWIFGK
ncbi:MAG: EpsG family protein [Anaeroplasma bactoclasticum]|nr:EpsG family protein [Anaeroplasma bactoclasticum]